MSLKTQTVSGIKWQVAVSFFQKAITFGTTIILARRLGPSVYGLFAFALVVVSSFELFKSLGVDAALIRRKDDYARAADTAFIIIPFLGISLYLLLTMSAPAIGRMLGNTEIVGVVRVLGLVFVIHCFSKVPNITLERDMKFKRISVAEIASAVTFSVVAITLVFRDVGVWTLVYAYIARTAVYMALVWFFSGWRPSFSFDVRLAREMLGFGLFVFMTSVLWFLKANLDHLLVGKLLGATMLGLYSVAFNVANFAPQYFGGRVYRVMYPAYARLQNDREGLQKAFLSVFRYVSLLAIPVGIGTFLLGGDFIRLAYGEKWIEAVPVLRILAGLAVFNMFPVVSDGIFMAIGRPSLSFWSVFVQVCMFFILVAPAARMFGLSGVAWVVLAASFATMLMHVLLAMKHLDISAAQIFESLSPTFVATACMVGSVLALRHGVPGFSAGRLVFLFEFPVAVLCYAGTLFVTNRLIVREMRELVSS